MKVDWKKSAQSLPAYLPTILTVVVVAVVIVVAVKGGKKLSSWISGDEASGFTDDQKEKIEDDVTRLSATMQPTYNESQYSQFAETLYQAMNFSSFNDFFTGAATTVKTTLKKMQNDLDVAKTVKAYGARQLHGFGLSDGAPMGLFAAINYDKPQTVADINADWQTKGITYRV